ncbi:hypothetical protein NQ176_g6852 [Zarea fungicola]|uniref:Uncharacterized protein n=1 Tax=Zarea fungicola TaxID=93591 RepID=A0ACC1N1M5_9HYPO|nr:hypothetical protein NQ176_g6852 [Lecanicillium fungicola]
MAFRPGPTYLPNQAATIPFKISSVPHRTGAPLLRPLPLDTVYSDPVVSTLNKTYGKPIKDTIRDILAKRGFPPQEYIDDPAGTTFEICQRHVPGDYENTKRLTIYVTAPWASNTGGTSWIKATKDIKTWADKFLHDIDMPERNLNSDPDARTVTGAGARFGIDVEIAALELLAEKFISVPPKIDDWLAGWPHVRDDVAKILQSFVESKSNWSCISLINFGPNESPDKNPTTVYIAMDQACDEHVMWTTIRPAIQEYIDHTPYGWSLHMEHRVSDNQAFDLHALSKKPTELLRFFLGEPYEDNVNLGASISVSSYVPADDGKKYNPMVGTLGCYVELQVDGKWQLFGLTNYHVIRAAIPGFKRTIDALVPERDTPLYKADHEGFFPGTFGSQAVESPSRTYHNATISMLQDSPDSTDEMQQKLEFFDNGRQILGHLWAGSGFGRRTERSGLLADGQTGIPRKHLRPKTIQGREMNPEIAPVHNIKNEPLFFKYGIATKGTSGTFSDYQDKVLLREWRYMHEEDPTKYPLCNDAMLAPGAWFDRFGAKGDSGAVVYDSKGRGACLLCSGTEIQSSKNNFTYVAPLELIFDDIQRFLGPRVSGIRIAQLEEKGPSPTKSGRKA